jgi:hypothetical protein
VVFHQRLQEHINTRKGFEPDQRKWVLKQYEILSHFPEWEDETLANAQGNDRNLKFLETVHDNHDQTTEYFLRLQRDHRIRYSQLVEAHLVHAVNYWGDATQHMRENKARYDPSWMRDWVAEGAHLYWDYLPRVVAWMTKEKTRYEMLTDEALVHEAWIVMMFRAFCWWRCHWMELGETRDNVGSLGKSRLPSRYWNSKFQVYIG